MNNSMLIHRLRGPAILLLIGVLALLHEMDLIAHPWRLFWPILLIMLGVLMLAERAALESEGYPIFPWMPWHGAAQPNPQAAPPQNAWSAANTAADPGTDLVPSPTHDFESGREGEKR